MTKPQVDKLADFLNQIALTALVGPIADLAVVGTRVALDLLGMIFGVVLAWASYRLTARMGGTKV